jgi:hypothetical protein
VTAREARRALAALLGVACSLGANAAKAAEATAELEANTEAETAGGGTSASPDPERLKQGFAAVDRPMGIAEAHVGVLTLPAAEVCAERSAGCKKGDVSFAVEAWQLYRVNHRLAFGAGIALGLIPTAHPRQDPEAIERDHTRSYLTVEGMLRYYPYVGEDLEVWGGILAGLVVVNDRFQVVTPPDDRALLGTRGVTLRTEGASLGAGAGFAYRLSEHFSFVTTVRYTEWFLPRKPATDPLGSEASLTGQNRVVSGGVGLAYRVAL